MQDTAELDERIDGLPAQVRAHADASEEQVEAGIASDLAAGASKLLQSCKSACCTSNDICISAGGADAAVVSGDSPTSIPDFVAPGFKYDFPEPGEGEEYGRLNASTAPEDFMATSEDPAGVQPAPCIWRCSLYADWVQTR